ncbi:hypothetical protein KP509_09G024400 [Ceratopteris richardii]|uniref:Uncharacterized protein n=1 Tax=Ceratopteris richardii TaxID=49495 RepID=A0A8T2TZS9_CERRI|nr:hypothetical protein KP509_09G024400 [Ceratopteris richardii]
MLSRAKTPLIMVVIAKHRFCRSADRTYGQDSQLVFKRGARSTDITVAYQKRRIVVASSSFSCRKDCFAARSDAFLLQFSKTDILIVYARCNVCLDGFLRYVLIVRSQSFSVIS